MPERRYASAIVVGKFLPPHAGHHSLIEHAQSRADRVLVLLVDGHGELPSADRRALWLQAIHPEVDVVVAADLCRHGTAPCVIECSDRWAAWLGNAIPERFDLVVSSETYGQTFAERIGATHISFDPQREGRAVSGDAVRADLLGQWLNLHPIVRAGLHRRVVILGAESTGSTTLARDLAKSIGAPVAMEAGRTASWVLAGRFGGWDEVEWNVEDFRRILANQRRLEADAAHRGALGEHGALGPWIVCDTDALATVAWWERYLDEGSEEALAFARSDLADLYLVTDPTDVEFVQDGIRDGEHVRHVMHQRFCELAHAWAYSWKLISGTSQERVTAAISALTEFERQRPRFVTTDNLAYAVRRDPKDFRRG
jgi:HTH-type transcriptional repressor of NAD biosynthesis genes